MEVLFSSTFLSDLLIYVVLQSLLLFFKLLAVLSFIGHLKPFSI